MRVRGMIGSTIYGMSCRGLVLCVILFALMVGAIQADTTSDIDRGGDVGSVHAVDGPVGITSGQADVLDGSPVESAPTDPTYAHCPGPQCACESNCKLLQLVMIVKNEATSIEVCAHPK